MISPITCDDIRLKLNSDPSITAKDKIVFFLTCYYYNEYNIKKLYSDLLNKDFQIKEMSSFLKKKENENAFKYVLSEIKLKYSTVSSQELENIVNRELSKEYGKFVFEKEIKITPDSYRLEIDEINRKYKQEYENILRQYSNNETRKLQMEVDYNRLIRPEVESITSDRIYIRPIVYKVGASKYLACKPYSINIPAVCNIRNISDVLKVAFAETDVRVAGPSRLPVHVHPHLRYNCMGAYNTLFSKAIEDSKYTMLLSQLIKYITEINITDYAVTGSSSNYISEGEADEIIKNNPRFILKDATNM